MPLIIPANTLTGGYEVANSCRFNDDDSANLTKTFGSAGNRKTWTFSAWIKRGTLGEQNLLQGGNSGYNDAYIRIASDNTLRFLIPDGSSATGILNTTQVLRDSSAWYHIVCVYDSSNATSGERVRMYINGNRITNFSTETYPDQDTDSYNINNASPHYIGSKYNSTSYFDGYMAEVCFIDGLALTPTSFGEFDEDSPTIWKPIDVSELTFGTNGFYLDYEDSADLGADVSGNSNDFTVNNLAATDQATDTPTNNFATLNPLDINPSNTNTFAEGNLKLETNGVGARSTIAVENGQWYCEVKHVENTCWNGIMDMSTAITATTNSVLLYTAGTTLYIDGSNQGSGGYGAGWSANDILMMALDLESGTKKLYFGKNGNWWDTDAFDAANPTTGITLDDNVTYGFWSTSGSGDPVAEWNFGSPPYSITSGNADANGYGNFEYAVPSGYYALCTKNLAEYG